MLETCIFVSPLPEWFLKPLANKATEAELAAARKKSAMDPKNLKKTNPPKNDARSKDRDVASKSKSQTHVAPVAKKTVPAPSSAPAGPSQPSKRHRSKSSPLDASTPADDLAKAVGGGALWLGCGLNSNYLVVKQLLLSGKYRYSEHYCVIVGLIIWCLVH